MTLIVLLASLALVLLSCFIDRAKVTAYTGALSLAYWILIFTGYSTALRGVSSLAVFVALVVAVCRSGQVLKMPGWPVSLFVFWNGIVIIFASDDLPRLIAGVADLSAQLLLIAVVSSSFYSVLVFAQLVVPIIVVVQFFSSLNELFWGGNALWPRNNGSTWRLIAVNHLVDDIRVRSMGSTGYSITLGILAGCMAIICMWVAIAYRRKLFWIYGSMALSTVIFSGSRTALVALLVAALIAVFTTPSKYRFLIATLISPIIVWTLVFHRRFFFEFVGFSANLDETRSFQHRLGVAGSMSDLLHRGTDEVILGGGATAGVDAFNNGLVSGVAGISAFDNQYIKTLVVSGIIGLFLMLMSILVALFIGHPVQRALVVFLSISCLAYDVLSWLSLTGIFLFAVCAWHSDVSSTNSSKARWSDRALQI